MPRPTLDATEVRVAGALVEKALATPDAYPLSLNALVAACNQKTARDPVMALAERDVTAALDRLGRRGWSGRRAGRGTGSPSSATTSTGRSTCRTAS